MLNLAMILQKKKKVFEVLCVNGGGHKLRKGKNSLFILLQIFMFVFLAVLHEFASFLIPGSYGPISPSFHFAMPSTACFVENFPFH